MKGVIKTSIKSYKFKYDKNLFKTDIQYRNDILYSFALMDQAKYM